jgi:hypothetical protein
MNTISQESDAAIRFPFYRFAGIEVEPYRCCWIRLTDESVNIWMKSIHEIACMRKQLIAGQFVWRLLLSDRPHIGNGRIEDPVNVGPMIAPK